MIDTNTPDALTQQVADHAATALAEARAMCNKLRTSHQELVLLDIRWRIASGSESPDELRARLREAREIVGCDERASFLARLREVVAELGTLRKFYDARMNAAIGDDAVNHDSDCCCSTCSAVMEPLLRAIEERERCALQKPAAVRAGQRWRVAWYSAPSMEVRYFNHRGQAELYEPIKGCAPFLAEPAEMLTSDEWTYLGESERPIEPTDGAWSGAIPPEQLQAAVDRMSAAEKEMLASLVSRGESKVGGYYAQQFGAPAGCMCTWITRPQSDGTTLTERGRGAVPCPVHDTRSEEARMGDLDSVLSEASKRVAAWPEYMHSDDVKRRRAAFDARLEAMGVKQERSSEATSDGCGYCGDPARAEVPAQDGKAVVADRATTAHAEPVAEDGDERWQPGAVWEHGSARLTMHIVRDAEVVFRDRLEPVPRARMTAASGWRYVGRSESEAPQVIRIERSECPETGELLYRRSVPASEASAIECARADGLVEGCGAL